MNHVEIGVKHTIFAQPEVFEVGRYALKKVNAYKLVKIFESWSLERILSFERRGSQVGSGIVIGDTPKQHHGFQEEEEGVRICLRMLYEDIFRCQILGISCKVGLTRHERRVRRRVDQTLTSCSKSKLRRGNSVPMSRSSTL